MFNLTKKKQNTIKSKLDLTTHVIIKIGTATLTPHIKNRSNYFSNLAKQVKKLQAKNKNVIIVSSGAVGFGRKVLSTKKDQFQINEKQALASVGQSYLMEQYRSEFLKNNVQVGQILVSKNDFTHKRHFKNLYSTIEKLLEWNIVPVINENDAVAIRELKLGDNDTLSGFITSMFPQAFLLMLSTATAFNIDDKPIAVIGKIDKEIIRQAGNPSALGTGGMKTKVKTANNLMRSGQIMFLCSGEGENPKIISQAIDVKAKGTWFFDFDNKPSSSSGKRFLFHTKYIHGSIVVDKGAVQALQKNNSSLLVVGITSTKGNFDQGETINILDEKNKIIARGYSKLSNASLTNLITKKQRLKNTIAVHKDQLILL